MSLPHPCVTLPPPIRVSTEPLFHSCVILSPPPLRCLTHVIHQVPQLMGHTEFLHYLCVRLNPVSTHVSHQAPPPFVCDSFSTLFMFHTKPLLPLMCYTEPLPHLCHTESLPHLCVTWNPFFTLVLHEPLSCHMSHGVPLPSMRYTKPPTHVSYAALSPYM